MIEQDSFALQKTSCRTRIKLLESANGAASRASHRIIQGSRQRSTSKSMNPSDSTLSAEPLSLAMWSSARFQGGVTFSTANLAKTSGPVCLARSVQVAAWNFPSQSLVQWYDNPELQAEAHARHDKRVTLKLIKAVTSCIRQILAFSGEVAQLTSRVKAPRRWMLRREY